MCIAFLNSTEVTSFAKMEKLLRDHVFIHVRVVPKEKEDPAIKTQSIKLDDGSTTEIYEVCVTHEAIRGFSPMVAYSGFDVLKHLTKASA